MKLVQFSNQVKSSYILRSFYIIFFLAVFPPFLISQAELSIVTLNLLKGPIKGGSRIIEFKPSTIILKVKMKGISQYVEQEIPATAIKDISFKYDYSSGRGAAKGLIKGTLIGLTVGLLSSIGTDDDALSGTYIGGGTLMGGVLGTLFGFAGGSYKKKKYTIDGNIAVYQTYVAEMQELLLNE